MKLTVIWIDREHAKVFHVSDGSMERKRLWSEPAGHHPHRREKPGRDREETALFREAAAELTGSDRVILLGPGVAKHHFRNFLAEQRPLLCKKVVGIETVDHPSDGQIAAMAKLYFGKTSA
jgi:stalled ribosome rescue protein Dom34